MRILLWIATVVFAFVGAGLTYGEVQYAFSRIVEPDEIAFCVALGALCWFPALALAALAWAVTLLERR